MAQYTKQEAVEVLKVGKASMEVAKTKDEAIAILTEVGKEVGYKPTFRCLVLGQNPEQAITWGGN
ncbi:MAG: hypothetical protein ABR958_01695 [Dehalococcoidales bacterium]|jgi:hypothetical protein